MKTTFWTELFDLIAPRPCVICGGRLTAGEQVICGPCHMHLPLTRYEQSAYDNPMARLFWGQFPVERAAALFFYEPQSPTSRLVYDMKYHGRSEVAVAMGQIMARQMGGSDFFSRIDAIIPIPLTWRRQWQRGYNQSAELAQGLSSICGLPVWTKVVTRTHFSQSQTHQHAWERQQNVSDAFRLRDAGRIAHKHVLLVDDIVTTGATITACARTLAEAPGVRISVLSLGLTKS